jgi:DNA-binding transcriptional ArsR family regulator
MILAHHGGVLFSTDPDELLSQLEDLCADAPLDLRLASEDANDRAALLRRLARLRGSADVRRNYADLVRDVWAVVATDWLRDGERAVAAAVAERRDLLRRGASWREVARDAHCSDAEVLFSLVEGLGPQGAIGLVPAYFAHLGSLVDLPGMVLIGVRADGSGAQARARTELLARRLKTISDPTRLAMLEALRSSPRTVSELAHLFSLAQPTVSNHVKVLRESGLVANGSDGDRRKLMLQPDVLTDLIDHLSGILAVRAADVH